LCLYDTNKAAIGGAKNEFIHSARIDNLMSSFCAVTVRIYSIDTDSYPSCPLCPVSVLRRTGTDRERYGRVPQQRDRHPHGRPLRQRSTECCVSLTQ
jgi:hypothetical protein